MTIDNEKKFTAFQSIKDASRYTGISTYYIRQGVKKGEIPHIMCGTKYLINVPQWLENLNKTTAVAINVKGENDG